MSARPRSVSDAELLAATGRAVSRVGPSRLTLADVAREAGVAPATLVQRFGSKRDLLLAFVQQGSVSGGDEMAVFRDASVSPLKRLRHFAECFALMAPTPEELANHLAFLVMDLTDPAFHKLTLEQFEAFQAEMEGLIKEAVKAGELERCDSAALARLLQETIHGALVTWAIYREGTALEWVRREFDGLMARYLVRRGVAKRRAKRSEGRGQ